MAATTKVELQALVTRLQESLDRSQAKNVTIGKSLESAKTKNRTLSKSLAEALEHQTATSEVLKVISRSTFDLQPVLDTLIENATRLCGAESGIIYRFEGDVLRMAANYAASTELKEFWRRAALRPGPGSATGRAVLERRTVHIPDALADPGYEMLEAQRVSGFRTLLCVPMLREGVVLGVIATLRNRVDPFTDKQIGLLETFADQAVIAIENVRLFNEINEALEQQTATAEILKVISSSPTDLQPVFDAILEGAALLCDSRLGTIGTYDGQKHEYVAVRTGNPGVERWVLDRGPFTPHPGGFLSKVLANGKPDQTPDLRESRGYRDRRPLQTLLVEQVGVRTHLSVPMLKDGRAVGTITIYRAEVRPFTQKQIDLITTFANQAVIAIENVRLFKELQTRNAEITEALEQQTATANILRVISSSPTDFQPVLEAVAESAARLCEANDVTIQRVDGEVLRVAVHVGPLLTPGPRPVAAKSVITRAVRELRTMHVHDVGDPRHLDEYPDAVSARRRGYRTILIAPLVREATAIGAIAIRRAEVRPFSDKQVKLLETFAAQAVIAIENVRLFKELLAQTEALSRSVNQLTALGEVGQAISSSLDLETVLKTIVSRALLLTRLDAGSIYEYDPQAQVFRLQTTENMADEVINAVRSSPIRIGDGVVGRTGVTREITQVPDILDPSYQSGRRELLVRAGYRALLAVPLLRDEHLLGVLLVHRKSPGEFAPEVVDLLKTFATQSALAIQNARLFREIAEKGRQLEEASQHKSQFLASMSHELRTPLNAILGFNEMILGEIYGDVPTDMQAPLAQMQTSGKHLLRLINNVLDLAKIEAGRMELSPSDYVVHDVVESVRSTLQSLATDKGLEFAVVLPADLLLAHGDAGRITQCLMNLAGNSIKFTKEGKVEITVECRDALLVYRVADTGMGIPTEKIGSLFTEFKQTDASIASEFGGTGLGLSISKKFIEMHGGRIWVESELGKGSTFIFEIPLRLGDGEAT